MTLSDNDIMPFGKYKGQKMIEVPDSYLKWLWRENEYEFKNGMPANNMRLVMTYINESFTEDELK